MAPAAADPPAKGGDVAGGFRVWRHGVPRVTAADLVSLVLVLVALGLAVAAAAGSSETSLAWSTLDVVLPVDATTSGQAAASATGDFSLLRFDVRVEFVDGRLLQARGASYDSPTCRAVQGTGDGAYCDPCDESGRAAFALLVLACVTACAGLALLLLRVRGRVRREAPSIVLALSALASGLSVLVWAVGCQGGIRDALDDTSGTAGDDVDLGTGGILAAVASACFVLAAAASFVHALDVVAIKASRGRYVTLRAPSVAGPCAACTASLGAWCAWVCLDDEPRGEEPAAAPAEAGVGAAAGAAARTAAAAPASRDEEEAAEIVSVEV